MSPTTVWSTMTRYDKLSKVCQLSTMRLGLLEKSRKRRAAKGGRKKREKKMTFRTPELRAFFDTMPDDMRKFVGG